MKKRNILSSTSYYGVVVSMLLPLLLCVSCSKNEDVEAIRAVIEAMRVAAEQKHFDKVLGHVTEDYSDNVRHTKKTLRRRFERTFSKFERLKISVSLEKFEVNGLTATVPTKVKVSGFRNGEEIRIFGSPGLSSRVQIYVEKRSNRWRVVGSTVQIRRGLF